MQGTISKIIHDRGYGFIYVEGQEGNIFFHRSQISEGLDFDKLKEGQIVNFDLETTEKGPQAVNLTA